MALLVAPGPAGAAIVTNGDFEPGSLSGWLHADSPVVSSDSWFVYSGTTSPSFNVPIAAPPQGLYAAVTDQGGPGRRILYQDVAVRQTAVAQLSAFVYYRDSPGATLTSPPNLDYMGAANQQYRFDVVRPAAAVDSVSSSDVLATLFQTPTGGAQVLAPTQRAVDLSALAGQTVRLRAQPRLTTKGPYWRALT